MLLDPGTCRPFRPARSRSPGVASKPALQQSDLVVVGSDDHEVVVAQRRALSVLVDPRRANHRSRYGEPRGPPPHRTPVEHASCRAWIQRRPVPKSVLCCAHDRVAAQSAFVDLVRDEATHVRVHPTRLGDEHPFARRNGGVSPKTCSSTLAPEPSGCSAWETWLSWSGSPSRTMFFAAFAEAMVSASANCPASSTTSTSTGCGSHAGASPEPCRRADRD